MALEKKLNAREGLGNRNLMRLYMAQSWVERKIEKYTQHEMLARNIKNELNSFGITIHFLSNEGKWL